MPGACVWVGVQAKSPETELMLAPVGAPGSKVNAKVSLGKSASVAELVMLSGVSSTTFWFGIELKLGGELSSFRMVQTARVVRSCALIGLKKVRKNALSGSLTVFPMIDTAMVLFVSPGLNVSVPLVGVKS